MNFINLKVVVCAMLFVASVALAEARDTVRVHLRFEATEGSAVAVFSCDVEERCQFLIGDFELNFDFGRRVTSVQVQRSGRDYVFFNEKSIKVVEYGGKPEVLNLYDKSQSDFVKNGNNVPIGFVEIYISKE